MSLGETAQKNQPFANSSPTTFTASLPEPLYTSGQVREGEKQAAENCGIGLFELMQRAGQAVFDVLKQHYPDAKHILVCSGKGNNGGDGYIVASLAINAGMRVSVWQIGDANQLTGDAKQAMHAYLDIGGEIQQPCNTVSQEIDIIIDGLLGTGISGDVRSPFAELIGRLNQASIPIISIDTPSGLDTDTGTPLGSAIQADATVSFIGLKQGLVTGQARQQVGKLYFAGLGVDDSFKKLVPTTTLLSRSNWLRNLKPRVKHAHKGTSGKATFIGGDEGLNGAIYLAARSAARSGTGMIAVLCHVESATAIRTQMPEAMVSVCDNQTVSARMEWANVACLGPGLGRHQWGEDLFTQCESYLETHKKPRVLDADALFWLATTTAFTYSDERIITPHPGEAAALLGQSIASIEKDRFAAATKLQKRYGGVVVLKGAGTLIRDSQTTVVCHAGNPGMATGGMGDVLSGVITAFLAQGYNLEQSARLGTLVHSLAADECALKNGEIGMLASDLFEPIRHVVNQRKSELSTVDKIVSNTESSD